MDKKKQAILFNGTAKEIKPHMEDLKKRYDTVEQAVKDLGSELNKIEDNCEFCGKPWNSEYHMSDECVGGTND